MLNIYTSLSPVRRQGFDLFSAQHQRRIKNGAMKATLNIDEQTHEHLDFMWTLYYMWTFVIPYSAFTYFAA